MEIEFDGLKVVSYMPSKYAPLVGKNHQADLGASGG